MLMEGNPFKLGEYRITDFGSGVLYWEAHVDFGTQKSGRCFQVGEVLVLGEPEKEKSGFLKGEFLDSLRKLPSWSQTRYYCLSTQLRRVQGGGMPDHTLFEKMTTRRHPGRVASEWIGADKSGPFRLGRYRIDVTRDHGLTLQTWREGRTVVAGGCSLQGGILVIEPSQGLGGEQDGKEFNHHLRRLPPWRETLLWCRQDVLRQTQAPIEIRIPPSRQRPHTQKPRIIETGTHEKTGITRKAGKALWGRLSSWRPSLPPSYRGWSSRWPNFSRARSLWPSGFKFSSPSLVCSRWFRSPKPESASLLWQATVKRKWVWISLIIIGLLLVLLLAVLHEVLEETHDDSHHGIHHYSERDH
jgi:hypothetical protein